MTTQHTHVDETGLDDLNTAERPARDASAFRRIIAAREAVIRSENELRQAVADARAAGDSWTIIGAALDISRQAAQQRFSHP